MNYVEFFVEGNTLQHFRQYQYKYNLIFIHSNAANDINNTIVFSNNYLLKSPLKYSK